MWRSQRPRLTVIPCSYYSKLIAGSICVTLKDFWIVWIGQDSCYRSLYMIECSLIDLIPEEDTRWFLWFGYFGQPHLRWEWWAIIPSSPVVMIVFYHAIKVFCYHFFWAVKSQLSMPYYTGVYYLSVPPGIQLKCTRCWICLHWLLSQHHKVA